MTQTEPEKKELSEMEKVLATVAEQQGQDCTCDETIATPEKESN